MKLHFSCEICDRMIYCSTEGYFVGSLDGVKVELDNFWNIN